MADTYGVKVKLQYQTNKSDLRGQLQGLLDGATQNSPLTIKNFKVSSPGLRKALNAGFKEASTPLTLSNIKLNLSASALSEFQTQLNAKELTLTIKNIKADQAVNNLRSQLVRMLSGLQISGVRDFLDGEDIRAQSQAIESYVGNLERLKTMRATISKSGAQLLSFGTNNSTAELQRALTLYKELNDQVNRGIEAKGHWDNIDGLQEELRTLVTLIATHKAYLDSLRQEAAAREAEADANIVTLASNRQLLTLRSQINNWLQKNTKATQASRTQLQEWATELSLGNVSMQRYQEISNGVKEIDIQTRKAGQSGKTFFETFKSGLEKFGGWSLVTRSLTMVYSTLKKMVTTVIELDSAMTELRRVTDLTEAGYRRFTQTAIVTAKNIGASVKDTINATADFARLGYTVEEATQLAAAALTYKNIGDGIEDISTATESLISSMKAFGIEAEQSMYVIDMFNEVGNKFAISSKGIGDALQRSAAALAEGGNTIQESIAMITAANEIIQDPDVIGTAMKTLTMYLRAARTEAEDAGIATDGMANSVSELRDKILGLTGQKVDIMIDETTFKSTYQIMEELANIWKELDDITRSNLLNLIGGKRNANTFSALLNNFDTAAKALKTAMDAAGSASRENEEYLKSIEGRIVRLQASFEALSQSVINSSLIKWFVDIIRYATEFATLLSDIGVLLPTLFTGYGLKGIIQQLATVKSQFHNTLQDVFSMAAKGDGSYDFDTIVQSLTKATSTYTEIQKVQLAQLLQTSDGFKQLTAEQQANLLQQTGLTRAVSASTTGFKAFGVSVKQAWAAMSLFEKASVIMAVISTVYTVISSVINAVAQAEEEARAKVKSAADAAAESSKAVSSLVAEYLDLQQSLADGAISNESYIQSVNKIISSLRKEGETVNDLIDQYGDLDKAILAASRRELESNLRDLNAGLSADKQAVLDTHGTLYNGSLYSVPVNITIYDKKAYKKNPELYDAILSTLQKAIQDNKWYTNQFAPDRGVGFNIGSLYPTRTDSTHVLKIGSTDSIDFANADAELDYIRRRRDALAELLDTLNQIEGARETSLYTDIYNLYSGLDQELSALEERVIQINDTIAQIAVVDVVTSGNVPKTQQEFDALRATLIQTVAASQSLATLDGDATKAAEAAVDSVLTNYSWAQGFSATLLGIPPVTKKVVSELSNTISTLQKAADIISSAKNDLEQHGSLSADTLNSMASQLQDGEDILDYLTLENGALKLNVQAWQGRADTIASDAISAWSEEKDALEAFLSATDSNTEYAMPEGFVDISEVEDRVDLLSTLIALVTGIGEASDDASKPVQSMSDAIGEFNTAVSLMEDIRTGDTLSALENIMSLVASGANISMSDFFDEQGLKNADDILTSITNTLLQNLEDVAAKHDITWDGAWTIALREQLAQAGIEAEETDQDVRSLTDAISEYNTAVSLIEDLRAGDTLSALENIMSLVASGAHINMSDFFDEQGLKNTDEILTSITNTLLQNLEDVAAKHNITWDGAWTIALREQLAQAGIEAEEAEQDVRSLTDAISEYNTAVSLMENLRAGDTLSVLENIMSLVASGAHINMSDFFDEQGLKSADDILASISDTLLQNLEELAAKHNITWDNAWTIALREQLAQAGIEAEDATESLNEQVTAYERLTEAATKANSAIANTPVQGDLVPLTKEAYDELIATDSRYASAVQYQNGVLTLNRDAYAAVTQQILQNTKAQAAAEIQAIVTSDKYLDLTSRIGSLDAAEQQQLDSLNAEIMGYSVLIHELENATSAYQRFINASTETDSGRYSAAENARKVIQDTLYDAESEIYGKIGREQYVAAMDFLIDPDIEVGTAEFDAALKTIDRYLEEGTSGVRNFYDDLIQHGFIDSSGVLNASMAEMADKLGVSMEFLRSMFDELNMYEDEEHKVKIECDTGDVETEALSAEEQLAALQAAASSLNETLDVDHTIAVDTDSANTSLGKVSSTLSSIISQLNSINNRRVTTYVHTVETSSASHSSNRPASVSGTRSAVGGRTLVGELGMETVVDPNTGSWYTVGRHGAEFVDLPKGAIVFNAGQTRRLFQAGRINSRGNESGQAMVAGGLVGSSTTPLFSMIAAEVGSIVPSIVEGVVSGVVDQASGSPVMPPADTDNGKKNTSSNRPDPSKKIEEMSDAFEEANKYMEHLIRHQEHLYEVAENGLDFPGMEASLTEQARLYREMMANAQQTVQQMIAAGAKDTDEALQKVEESYWSAYSSLYNVIGQINALYVDALNDKIDGLQSGYSTFSAMIEELGQNGRITVDTFQELVKNGLEYLNYLELVDGQYVINQEAIEKMVAAEKEQLAIEQALAYIAQIRQALTDDDPEKVAALANLTNQISDGTWDLVYANAALLQTMGLTDEQYASVIHNIDLLKSLTGQVNTNLDDGTKAYEDQQDALDKILDYTEQLIQYETEEKIKAIEDEIDAYEELVNLRKEALQTAKDEADYTSDVADRTKEIAALESRIAQLSLDDSRAAQAERAALEEELAKLQGDLADVQGDHAYDAQIAALDKNAENYRKSREDEIAELEASISSAEKLYQAALQRIDTGWDTLYAELLVWNTEAGNSLNSEITSNWELALEAAKKYGSYVEAIVARTGNPMAVVPVGTEQPSIYHDGGVVSASGLKHNEVVAVLEDGEAVLTQKQRTGLYRIVDFAKELSSRLGTAIKEIVLPFNPMMPALAGVDGVKGAVVSNQNSMNFSPEINVQITHNGSISDSDARSYGRQIGNIALQEMQQAFDRRGISGIFGHGLKQ